MTTPRWSRRTFLQGAASAAAWPFLTPSLGLADDKKPPASERLTLGFIGVGMMNRGHLGHFLRCFHPRQLRFGIVEIEVQRAVIAGQGVLETPHVP